MGKASRDKGARGELQVAHILQDAGWPKARRTHDGREQAMRGAYAGVGQPSPTPVVTFRRSGSPWLALIELDELLPLLALRERG
jgi:hypothetical protein